ncbi:Bgt-588 [Blumeria graminis f. sp. tritici]|uniref:Bgt-588 n=2 Tax=Blumeria graminis f. sp. tritici TaxID=62690 RepID=A0A061HFY0_BLUGR|nr:leupaxin [Blumeria graminis f. sp. tritici 96224]VDB92642.1 Bgt-588 [Blumeria graminis f. sp. tritici]
MPLRGRSKDRENTPSPGPVYMSNEEFADYLKNLRSKQIVRPYGARPFPSDIRKKSIDKDVPLAKSNVLHDRSGSPPLQKSPKPSNAFSSNRRLQSSLPNLNSATNTSKGRQLAKQPSLDSQAPLPKPSEIVPSATYIERGQRWMEREDAVALREAMQDMKLKAESEESRIYTAAQKEASELVWQHQNPDHIPKADQPYRYKNHLRKNSYQHARALSIHRHSEKIPTSGSTWNVTDRRRSTSRSSSGSDNINSQSQIKFNGTSEHVQQKDSTNRNIPDYHSNGSFESPKNFGPTGSGFKTQDKTSEGQNALNFARKKNFIKRNISGERAVSTFDGNQIWEEDEKEQEKHLRGRQQDASIPKASLCVKPKNPPNRVQFAPGPVLIQSDISPQSTKRTSCLETSLNFSLKPKNLGYIQNPPPDKTSCLPVKIAQNSKESIRDGLELRSEEIRRATCMRLKDRSTKLPVPSVVSDKLGRPIVSFDSNWKPKEADLKPEVRRFTPDRCDLDQHPQNSNTRSATAPCSAYSSAGLSPRSSSGEMNQHSAFCNVPEITTPVTSDRRQSEINTSPDHSPLAPSTIKVKSDSIYLSNNQPARPLPFPKSSTSQSAAQTSKNCRGHWSPAAYRATATCHQCNLPIEGRVLKLSGASEHYHPECFRCFTCGTGLESLEIHQEPIFRRSERMERHRRRLKGENVPTSEEQVDIDDGDERYRYYCHLDYHEQFAPKCKHCKTPIIGEHLVALGEHWHYGHFFCAECGEPFDKGMTHIEKDGYAWCLSCQTKRTERQAPKCKKCNLAVIGEYVQALGGEWHEKCFRCSTCKDGFLEGSFYPKQVEGTTTVMCLKCVERELKA